MSLASEFGLYHKLSKAKTRPGPTPILMHKKMKKYMQANELMHAHTWCVDSLF
jgi:hypothetical protein